MALNNVTKCICHDHLFSEIKEYADSHGITTVEELQDRNFCSNSCTLCVPYVEAMLQTGQVEFKPGEPFRTKQ